MTTPSISIDFFDGSGFPLYGVIYESISATLEYVKPHQHFQITMPQKQPMIVNSTGNPGLPDRIRATIKVFGIPYIHGFSYQRSAPADKNNGSKYIYEFTNLCGLLNMQTLDPRLVFQKEMTILDMFNLALANFRNYNPQIQFDIATTSMDIAIDATLHGKARVKRTLQRVAADDLQVRPGEKIGNWLDTILNRSGLILKEYCDASGMPILDIDVAKDINIDYSAPDYTLFTGNTPMLSNFGNPSIPQPAAILHQDEKFDDAEMPFAIVGLGHTYGKITPQSCSMRVVVPNEFSDQAFWQAASTEWSIISTTTTTTIPNNANILAGSAVATAGQLLYPGVGALAGAVIGQVITNSDLIDSQITYNTTTLPKMGEPDPYLLQWQPKFTNRQSNFYETIVSSDSPNEDCLIQKMTLIMRARQYNAYTLEYTLHQPKNSNMPILPNSYVQIINNSGKNQGIMWVSDSKLEYSKSKGLIQHIKLKIPNTYHLPESAPEIASQNTSTQTPYTAPNFGLPNQLNANLAVSAASNYQQKILSHIQKQNGFTQDSQSIQDWLNEKRASQILNPSGLNL